MRLAAVATALSFALAACTGDTPSTAPIEETTVSGEEPAGGIERPTTAEAPTSRDVRADSPDDCTGYDSKVIVRDDFDRLVQVALVCEHDGELHLVDRVVSAETDQVTAIVEQLFLGVTADEAGAGLHSSFAPYTAGQFDDVSVGADGVVVIHLGPGFVTASNFSTSFMSAQVFDQIATTLFAVPEVAGVEFIFEGQRWCGWEAGPCEAVPRPVIVRP